VKKLKNVLGGTEAKVLASQLWLREVDEAVIAIESRDPLFKSREHLIKRG
jgi:hypothetical protein